MEKRFELIVRTTEDNMVETSATNDGFSSIELVGILEIKLRDIYDQILHPEMFKHTRVAKNDDGTYDKIEEKETE